MVFSWVYPPLQSSCTPLVISNFLTSRWILFTPYSMNPSHLASLPELPAIHLCFPPMLISPTIVKRPGGKAPQAVSCLPNFAAWRITCALYQFICIPLHLSVTSRSWKSTTHAIKVMNELNLTLEAGQTCGIWMQRNVWISGTTCWPQLVWLLYN